MLLAISSHQNLISSAASFIISYVVNVYGHRHHIILRDWNVFSVQSVTPRKCCFRNSTTHILVSGWTDILWKSRRHNSSNLNSSTELETLSFLICVLRRQLQQQQKKQTRHKNHWTMRKRNNMWVKHNTLDFQKKRMSFDIHIWWFFCTFASVFNAHMNIIT